MNKSAQIIKMKRILVPTDFSPTAEKAFRFALDMAARAKGTIILFHAYTPVENTMQSVNESGAAYIKQIETGVIKRMQRLCRKVMADKFSVSVSTLIARKPVVNNIFALAEDEAIDLIVMGTRGENNLEKKVFGSTAEHVIRVTKIPVLLIPEKYELEEPHHFIFSTDCQSTDKHALLSVIDMASLFNATITVLHLSNSYGLTEEAIAINQQHFNQYSASIQEEVKRYNINIKMFETIDMIDALEMLDKSIPYDVMVMIRRKKSILEKIFEKSFTQNMAYLTHKPLLVIPQAKE